MNDHVFNNMWDKNLRQKVQLNLSYSLKKKVHVHITIIEMANPLLLVGKVSTSLSFIDKKELGDAHFKWNSIKKFLYLAYTFSSSNLNFDMFSQSTEPVTIFSFVIYGVGIGMSYMFMDLFIKQYTGKLDFNKTLNPLLRGITYGLLLQTALWTLIHACDLADVMRYFAGSFYGTPSWSQCHSTGNSCVSSTDMISSCRLNKLTDINKTSTHHYYQRMFKATEKSVFTSKLFVIGIVWICNFFFSTVSDITIMKLLKLAFLLRIISTILLTLLLSMSKKIFVPIAFAEIFNISAPVSYTASMAHVTYVYGIGLVGVYDFGTMSPYTFVDNAVVIFTILFTVFALMRSLVVKMLILLMRNCIHIDLEFKKSTFNPHYLLFCLLPLGTEFLHAQKVYLFFIYINSMIALITYIAILTLTMAKLLHSEFRSVKSLYIVGILCFIGFSLSLPISASLNYINGVIHGLHVTTLYLGALKSAIIMYIYGVNKFSIDIQFWLGFKPTKFWTRSWKLLPIWLFYFASRKFSKLYSLGYTSDAISAYVWVSFTCFIVLIYHMKTIYKCMVQNNLAAVFRSSSKYGPPDSDDRRQRRHYDESINFRQCKHNCMLLDEKFDCNHMPVMYVRPSVGKGGEPEELAPEPGTSLTHIYEAGPSQKIRLSSVMEIETA